MWCTTYESGGQEVERVIADNRSSNASQRKGGAKRQARGAKLMHQPCETTVWCITYKSGRQEGHLMHHERRVAQKGRRAVLSWCITYKSGGREVERIIIGPNASRRKGSAKRRVGGAKLMHQLCGTAAWCITYESGGQEVERVITGPNASRGKGG